MNFMNKFGTTALLSLTVASYASAGLIEGQLFNTGLNGGGALISGTEIDANWNTVLPDGNAVAYYNNAYAANDADSQWISIATDGAADNTDFRQTIFSTTFDLTGYDPSTAIITGLWGVDNNATISLNGTSTAVSLLFGQSSFNSLTAFNISDLFVSGENTLTVDLTNGYPDLTNDNIGPLALRFDDLTLTATKVSEPATVGLLGLGIAGLVAARRRRQA